jgi:hypothetical protein
MDAANNLEMRQKQSQDRADPAEPVAARRGLRLSVTGAVANISSPRAHVLQRRVLWKMRLIDAVQPCETQVQAVKVPCLQTIPALQTSTRLSQFRLNVGRDFGADPCERLERIMSEHSWSE